ncbi:hypothetical protein OAU10_01085 [Saprospiraceae bacterium]|jgi:hypothetical protein|nr:hypothetical protein [Saprospiraceae bacterium]MDG1434948.1 hypothetical protein [Saprospiraceae bacterium]
MLTSVGLLKRDEAIEFGQNSQYDRLYNEGELPKDYTMPSQEKYN